MTKVIPTGKGPLHYRVNVQIAERRWGFVNLHEVSDRVDFVSYIYKDGHESTVLEKASEVTGVRFNVPE